MITKELIDYIKNEKKLGKNEEIIRETLMKEGWSKEDLDQSFGSLNKLGIEKIIFFITSFAILIFLIARFSLEFLTIPDTSKGLLIVLLNTASISLNIIFLLSLPQLIIGIIFRKNKYGKFNLIISIIIIISMILFFFGYYFFLKELGFIRPAVVEEKKYVDYVPLGKKENNIPYIPPPSEMELILPENPVPDKDIDNYIKQSVVSLYRETQIGYDKIGYGEKPNNGNCFSPTLGSLFNPNNNYDTNIPKILNGLKEQGVSEMYCFSNPGESWAFAVKLKNQNGYFLVFHFS
jgi:hypothetical protein